MERFDWQVWSISCKIWTECCGKFNDKFVFWNWKKILYQKLKQLNANLEESAAAVARLERATLSWSGPRSAAEARELLSNLRVLEQQLPPLQRSLEEARAQAAMLGSALPPASASQLEDCSARCRALQAAIRERREQLTSSTQGILSIYILWIGNDDICFNVIIRYSSALVW